MQNMFIAIFLLIIASFIVTFLMTYRKNQKKMHHVCTASILGRIEDFEISHHQGEKLYTEVCIYEINKKTYTRRKRNEYIFYLRAKIGEYHLHFFTKSKSS
jgi:hypothetical protein